MFRRSHSTYFADVRSRLGQQADGAASEAPLTIDGNIFTNYLNNVADADIDAPRVRRSKPRPDQQVPSNARRPDPVFAALYAPS